MPYLKLMRDPSGTNRLLTVHDGAGFEFRNNAMTVKDSNGGSRVVTITGYAAGIYELTQGALNVTLDRRSGYITTGWGGAADMACRINVYNRALNTTAAGGIQGLRVYARQNSGGTIANMYGMECSLDERGSGGSPTVATAISFIASIRINGVCSANAHAAVFQCNSQGSISVATCTGAALVKFQSTQPIATGIRPTCLHFEVTGSGSGWTHAFSFQSAAGKEGFTAVVDKAVKGNIDGYIKVYDVATAQTLYIALYDTVPS